MKSILTVAALLAAFAVPAFAEEASPPPPAPETPAVIIAPMAKAAEPAALPQSSAAEVVPMSSPAMPEGEAMGKAGGGGCHHQATVYLTN